jgi:hypothetical protein
MVVRLQQSGDTFSFKLTLEEMHELAIRDGSAVEIKPASDSPTIRYMSVQEGLQAYEDTRLENDYAYRELAK